MPEDVLELEAIVQLIRCISSSDPCRSALEFTIDQAHGRDRRRCWQDRTEDARPHGRTGVDKVWDWEVVDCG